MHWGGRDRGRPSARVPQRGAAQPRHGPQRSAVARARGTSLSLEHTARPSYSTRSERICFSAALLLPPSATCTQTNRMHAHFTFARSNIAVHREGTAHPSCTALVYRCHIQRRVHTHTPAGAAAEGSGPAQHGAGREPAQADTRGAPRYLHLGHAT